MGTVEVPKDAYYGSFTKRALDTFKPGRMPVPIALIHCFGEVKLAAARANKRLLLLPPKLADAIIDASSEVLKGKFDSEFLLGAFQAGAGTPWNMNVNEVIANRANEALGAQKGSYKYVNANDHVNRCQSSNDATPTAIRVAALYGKTLLEEKLKTLGSSLYRKSREFAKIRKVGRTHLQDAVPITLGQEFKAYSDSISKDLKRMDSAFSEFHEIPLGGTALGTGANAHPKFAKLAAANLSKITRLKLWASQNPIELTQNLNAFVSAANSLDVIATDLVRISKDLQLLSSGPVGGLAELILPEVEPGSSIMPGKVNPSVPEAVEMACYSVMGKVHAIRLAAKAGNLEINVMTPLVAHELLGALELLGNAASLLDSKCIRGVEPNHSRIKWFLENSTVDAAALTPKLGYHKVSQLVREALSRKKTIRGLVLEKKLMAEKELDSLQ